MKILFFAFLLFTNFAYSALETVQPSSTIVTYGVLGYTAASTFISPAEACAFVFDIPNVYKVVGSSDKTCEVDSIPTPVAPPGTTPPPIHYSIPVAINTVYKCPTANSSQSSFPYRLNLTTNMCERDNPCPHTYLGMNTSGSAAGVSVGIGLVADTTPYSACDAYGCVVDVVPHTASVLGISLITNTATDRSCSDSSPATNPPIKVTFSPPSPTAQADYDALVAAAAASAAAAAAAAASKAAAANAAAQAAADKAAADALALLLAKAAALKLAAGNGGSSPSPNANPPPSPSSGTPPAGTAPPGTGGGTTPAITPATGTANCATFSICQVEQYLSDIKTALSFGQSFDSTAADAQMANVKTDNKSSLDKVVSDANSAQAGDENLVSSIYKTPVSFAACVPFTHSVGTRTVTIDICTYTEMLRELLGWLFAVFGAYEIYSTIFRK